MTTEQHYCNSCDEEIGNFEYMEQRGLCDPCIESIYRQIEKDEKEES
jgi:hypothetical protein